MTTPLRPDAPPSLRVPLVVAALLVAATLAGLTPPAPRGADADPARFSAARALAQLRALNPDDAPHPVASAANARVRDRLLARLRELGLEPEVQAGLSCARGACSWVENVTARIAGEAGGPPVMVAAHYDSRASAPGAADAGAGVAAALEVARALVHEAPPRDVLLLLDDGEEGGLHGARLFTRYGAEKVAGVVNLEARGTEGPSTMFETSEGNRELICWLASSATRPVASSLYFTIYQALPNDTDLTIFKAEQMPGLNYAFLGAPASYHTPRDRLDNLDRASLQHHGQNALELIRGAGGLAATAPGTGNAIYFDLFGRVLVHFPAGAAIPLALLALGLVLRRARDRDVPGGVGRIGFGLAGQLLGLVLSAAVLAGAHAALLAAGAAPARWIAHPGPLLASQWLLGMALAGGVAAVLGRLVGRKVTGDCYWLGLSLAGLATAFAAPGVSYLLWLPALVAGLAGHRRAALATLAPWITFAVLWMPHALMLYTALGLRLPGLHGLVAWLMVAPLGASLADSGRRVMAAGLVGALASSVAALVVPRFSEEVPCPLTLRFVEDGASARWEVLTFLEELPSELVAAAPFAPTGTPYGGLHSRVASFAAPAETRSLKPPEVEGSVLTKESLGLRWSFRLRSARGARRLGLTLPAGAPIREVRFLDQVVFQGAERPLAQARDLLVRLPAERALQVVVEVGDGPPPTLRVWDISDGLPDGTEAIPGARPAWAIQAHDADHTRVERELTPPTEAEVAP